MADTVVNANNGVNNPNNRPMLRNRYDIASLSLMTYKNEVHGDEIESESFSCEYILPNQLVPFKGISIMSFNIRSMKSNFVNFEAELLDFKKIFDIMGFCETHLTDSIEALYKIDGFNRFALNNESNKGGVCIYLRDNLVCKERQDLSIVEEHLEVIFIECLYMKKSLTIGMLYRRPETSIDRFMEDLTTILNKINGRCILMGDFNLNLLKCNNNNHVNNFVNLMSQYNFKATVNKPTRVFNNSATIIDHIWINFDVENDCCSNIIFTGITDHFPVYLKLPNTDAVTSKSITYRSSGVDCDNAFKQRLESTDFSHVIDTNDVNSAFTQFNTIIFDLYNDCYPFVTRTIKLNKSTNPWMTAGLRQSIKTKNKLYKKFVKRPITYGNAYRMYRNNLTKSIKKAKNIYHQNKFNSVQGDVKKTWRTINSILGKTNKSQSIALKVNSQLITDSQAISNTFNEHFSSIASEVINDLPAPEISFDNYLRNGTELRVAWDPVTEPEMKRIVSKCNLMKPGPDDIPIKIIKDNINFLCPILTNLCNKSFSNGEFPEIHKIGKIVPLYKSKDRYDKTNYRPICLLNAISKILEKLAADRIVKHLESHNLLVENQFAYRKGKGTDHANIKFVQDVLK